MVAVGIQNRRELPVMFEQQEAVLGHTVHSRASTVNTLTDTDVSRVDQPLESPIKAVAGMIEASELHEFKKLVMAYLGYELADRLLLIERGIAVLDVAKSSITLDEFERKFKAATD